MRPGCKPLSAFASQDKEKNDSDDDDYSDEATKKECNRLRRAKDEATFSTKGTLFKRAFTASRGLAHAFGAKSTSTTRRALRLDNG